MLPLFYEMSKILKYTFRIPRLEVVNDELVESGFNEETYTFTLLHKGIGLFEEIASKPLMAYMLEIDMQDKESIAQLLSKDFIPNLARASYTKVENGRFYNNRATAEEFKKLPVFQNLRDDITFATELIQMATECMIDVEKAKAKTKEVVNAKKQ